MKAPTVQYNKPDLKYAAKFLKKKNETFVEKEEKEIRKFLKDLMRKDFDKFYFDKFYKDKDASMNRYFQEYGVYFVYSIICETDNIYQVDISIDPSFHTCLVENELWRVFIYDNIQMKSALKFVNKRNPGLPQPFDKDYVFNLFRHLEINDMSGTGGFMVMKFGKRFHIGVSPSYCKADANFVELNLKKS